jgi:lipid II:glycine glycyltransferase (peptidoglycan interpeptide bridge formation enzyme)
LYDQKGLGLPPQPISFFYSIFQNIIAKGRGEIALVKVKNTSIAGALFLFSENEVLYKYGASDKSFQHMRANDILFWESIKRFAENGYKTLNFGKTEKFHEGLCRYKDGFGGMRFELYDYIYNVSTGKKLVDAPMVKGIYNNIFRIMPIPMLRFCGKLLYKYSA